MPPAKCDDCGLEHQHHTLAPEARLRECITALSEQLASLEREVEKLKQRDRNKIGHHTLG